MKKSEYLLKARENFNECIEVMVAKSGDYAQEEDPFANFRAVEAFPALGVSLEKGILVRLIDKFSRTANLLTREREVTDETIKETLLDAINYFNIIIIYLDDKKKEEECKCQ